MSLPVYGTDMGGTHKRPYDNQGPWQTNEAGNTRGHGQPRVELLAMRANLADVGPTIAVFDGKRGQIIYRKEEQGEQEVEEGQGEQGMVDLVLTGPYTGIDADGCFAIKMDIPAAAAGSSIVDDAAGSIKWQWDCDEPKYAAQVDALEPAHQHIIAPDGRKVAEVTYAVMSNALEATVQVMLRLKDDEDSCVHGKITAFISDFQVGSVLFRGRQKMGQRFSPTCSRFLQLARSVVAVPCGWVLRLEVDLQIETSKEIKPLQGYFIFDNGIPSQICEVDGNQIEVDVSWYPEHITIRSVPNQQETVGIEEIGLLAAPNTILMSRRQPDISYIVGDDVEGFSSFITELRRKVADHPSREDVLEYHANQDLSTVREHPVLAQEVRWVHIKLQVVDSKEELWSTTLVMRDDNLYVMGFMNQIGVWYELAERKTGTRMLPSQYNSRLLDWGNCYKRILNVRSQDEVVKILDSRRLGKTFVMDAVRELSRYSGLPDGDEYRIRLKLAGVIVMICESARLNPLRDAFVHGWNTGAVLTKQLMDYTLKWELISSALLRWKDHMYYTWIGYPELERTGIQSPQDALHVIHLVCNIQIQRTQEKYAVGDLLSFAYPEMLEISFPEMFKDMSAASVQVNLRQLKKGHINSVYGKIAALISDDHRHSVNFRVGSMLFTRTEESYRPRSDSGAPLPLGRSVVAVPSGFVLHILVDLQIETSNNGEVNHLKGTLTLNNDATSKSYEVNGAAVEVKFKWCLDGMQDFPPQLSQPVEVLETMSGNPTVVYTIGDAMSYTEFIMALRRILADHPDREDILDGHDLLNLSSSREHPLLAKGRAGQPARWIHVKLQVMEGEETSSTTLLVRDDNLYVIGFFNENGVLYRLVNNNDNSKPMIPEDYYGPTEDLVWGVSYKSLLKVKTIDEIARELLEAKLGIGFAMDAVCVLSRYPNVASGITMNARIALAGLMVMVCDSARMNPVHDAIATGWSTGTGFTKQLMECIGNWGLMSSALRRWKRGSYAEQNCYSGLRDTYLVLNDDIGIYSSKIDDSKKVPRLSETGMVKPRQSHQPEQTSSKETGDGQETQKPSRAPPEEHSIGDLLSFAFPEMLKVSFPEMFMETSMATVQVNLWQPKKGQQQLKEEEQMHMESVYGKIAALISDEERHSVCFRVGSMLFTRTQGDELICSDSPVVDVPLARSAVAVPSGWILHIEVDLYVKIRHKNTKMIKNLKVTFHFDKGNLSQTQSAKGTGVEVKITWADKEKDKQYFLPQLNRPVEVLKTMSGHPTVVYTIGDAMSFNEFIMALRRILADHPGREDILDGHDLLNLSSTRQHPLLPKQRAEQPARWLHVKLQVMEGEETSSTTLIMRDDNLYVCGFAGQNGVVYELGHSKANASILPMECNPQCLEWSLGFKSILGAKSEDKAVHKLTGLGRDFAMEAVRRLSSSIDPDDDHQVAGMMSVRVALAGLVIMVCDSAKMNTFQKAISDGWSTGTEEFTKQQLMAMHMYQKHEEMSRKLREWKSRDYAEPHCVSELQATYLVLNTRLPGPGVGTHRQGRGRPRVALLSMRAIRDTTKVIVFDGKRGHIVYSKAKDQEEREQGEMIDLELTGPYMGISAAYGCFTIKVDIPNANPARLEWDCDDPEYANEVDAVLPSCRDIEDPDGRKIAKVTYAVMSNALEATAQVMLDLKNGHSLYGDDGKITALIDGFGRQRTQVTDQCLSPVENSQYRRFQLARNVVAVPCGKDLQIEVDVPIKTPSEEVKRLKANLQFNNGELTAIYEDDGVKVQVNIAWYPEISRQPGLSTEEMSKEELTAASEPTGLLVMARPSPPPDQACEEESGEQMITPEPSHGEAKLMSPGLVEVLEYTIGDEMSFIGFIRSLRRILADHPDREDILDRHKDPNLSSTRDHPMLPNPVAGQPVRWIHVKLQVVEGDQTSSTTLVMRDDNLYVLGFKDQNGDWFELCETPRHHIRMLPPQYSSKLLNWGITYKSMLGVRTGEDVVHILESEMLGKDFAANAVHVLSRFTEDDVRPNRARRALVGLIVIFCDSARLNPLHDAFAESWGTGAGFTKQLMTDYVWSYGKLSRDLRDWKERGYSEPHPISQLRAVHLVPNTGTTRLLGTSSRRAKLLE